MGEMKPLERGARVRFQVGALWDEYVDAYIVDWDGGSEKRLALHGGRGFSVHPHSSNLVYVEIPDRT